jgi:hypothetical protein
MTVLLRQGVPYTSDLGPAPGLSGGELGETRAGLNYLQWINASHGSEVRLKRRPERLPVSDAHKRLFKQM